MTESLPGEETYGSKQGELATATAATALCKMIEDAGEIAQLASEFVSTLDNLPLEVNHIIKEIEHKDQKVQGEDKYSHLYLSRSQPVS